jgi:hypothetical protein
VILNFVILAAATALVDETYYDRTLPRERQPQWKSRWLRLVGIERHGRGEWLTAISRPALAIIKLPVLLIIVFYFLFFAWVISLNATISTFLTELYEFQPYQLGE